MDEHDPAPSGAALGAALVYCEACGKETPHRILRVQPADVRTVRTVKGIARCRECRWTHPFVSTQPTRVPVDLVVSRGERSERRRPELAPSTIVRVGERLQLGDAVVLVRKIDLRDSTSSPEAPAQEVRTIWAVADEPRRVRLAIVDGPRSTTEKIAPGPNTRWAVGDELRLPSGPATIVALRARDRTWRRPGDAFRAEEVTVVYARRTVRPPAGRSVWSRGRGTPRDRASSTSAAPRSRSSPGVRR